jgi:hypothetical protein
MALTPGGCFHIGALLNARGSLASRWTGADSGGRGGLAGSRLVDALTDRAVGAAH